MADTVSDDVHDKEYMEYVDNEKTFEKKIDRLVQLIQEHRGNICIFTGAGISTSSGIPDFRSGLNSCTGMPAGKWCKDATEKGWTEEQKQEERKRRRRTVNALQALPTRSHMALCALERRGYLLGIVSQNCDGLHRRSGFNTRKLAELHGNTNLEYCGWCGKEYFRDYCTYRGRHSSGARLKRECWSKHKLLSHLINPRNGNHYTGRRCVVSGCGGYLFDSTIDFGDALPEDHLDRAFEIGRRATLCIVLGSRCTVSPACDVPIKIGRSGRQLVVVNLQRTGADCYASLRIGAKIDDAMTAIMRKLDIPIPSFRLQRNIVVTRTIHKIVAYARDRNGLPDDCIWNIQTCDVEDPPEPTFSVRFNGDSQNNCEGLPQPNDHAVVIVPPWGNSSRLGMADVRMLDGKCRGQVFSVSPSICDVRDECVSFAKNGLVRNGGTSSDEDFSHEIRTTADSGIENLTIMFRAHYGEKPLRLAMPKLGKVSYSAEYDPLIRAWEVSLRTTEMCYAKGGGVS